MSIIRRFHCISIVSNSFAPLLLPIAENVLVLEGGRRVKLSDFSMATHKDDVAGCIQKLKGVSPHFTSPEVSIVSFCVCIFLSFLSVSSSYYSLCVHEQKSMCVALDVEPR